MASDIASQSNSGLYHPIPSPGHIRVLRLYPGCHGEEIKCTLEMARLEDMVDQYEAISYVWGDPSITTDVTCNEITVPITVNLADALNAFRDPKETRTLWADALCINQKDDAEKGNQVRLMGDIYEKARRVKVWLGRDTNSIAEDCFAFVTSVVRYFDEQYIEANRSALGMPSLEKPYPLPIEEVHWSNVCQLFCLPWFSRVWVVQESALAKECNLFWGTQNIDVADIFEFAMCAANKSDLSLRLLAFIDREDFRLPYSLYADIHTSYQHVKNWKYTRPFIAGLSELPPTNLFSDVLDAGSSLKATDPRDFIFAFLANPKAKELGDEFIVDIDYTKSADDVLFDTARALLTHHREAPWLLHFVQHEELYDSLLSTKPSWVPCWNGKGAFYPQIANMRKWFCAGGSNHEFRPVVGDGRLLKIRGFAFDRIRYVSQTIGYPDAFSRPERHNDTCAANTPWVDIIEEELSNIKGIRPLEQDEFSLTLVEGYGSAGSRLNSLATHRAHFAAYRRHVGSVFDDPCTNDSEQIPVQDKDFFESNLIGLMGHRLARTESGRIGIVPPAAQVGDVSCIILGLSTPFSLRELGNGRYNLVGECYIHNVMGGELMKDLEAGKFEAITIVIE